VPDSIRVFRGRSRFDADSIDQARETLRQTKAGRYHVAAIRVDAFPSRHMSRTWGQSDSLHWRAGRRRTASVDAMSRIPHSRQNNATSRNRRSSLGPTPRHALPNRHDPCTFVSTHVAVVIASKPSSACLNDGLFHSSLFYCRHALCARMRTVCGRLRGRRGAERTGSCLARLLHCVRTLAGRCV
jgi:hypothetical protein